jgi:hypothetical protein
MRLRITISRAIFAFGALTVVGLLPILPAITRFSLVGGRSGKIAGTT